MTAPSLPFKPHHLARHACHGKAKHMQAMPKPLTNPNFLNHSLGTLWGREHIFLDHSLGALWGGDYKP
jgi:hypothetical protein